jgi:hypothetical protein
LDERDELEEVDEGENGGGDYDEEDYLANI